MVTIGRIGMVALVAGCSFDHGALPGNGSADASVSDGNGVDGEMPSADAQTCWMVAGVNVNVCLTMPLSGTTTINTDSSVDTMMPGDCAPLLAGSSNVCVIAADTLRITTGNTLRARGDKPLVLIAHELVVDGTIDVSSKLSGQRGAASDPMSCAAATGMSDAGGGAGGSFGGKGGDGGDDAGNGKGGKPANAVSNIATLRGGCPGSGGGMNGPYGGHAGGAVLLIADTLTITGTVNASGSAGNGATQGVRGGDGGSSGGMIAISAQSLMIDAGAAVFANGGHGGGGSSTTNAGSDGVEPSSPSSGGTGGAGGGTAGDGGTGFPTSDRDAENGGDAGGGGGGGGGGAGVIRIYAPNVPSTANISPPASQ